MTDGKAGPRLPERFRGACVEHVGLAHDADQGAVPVDDRQARHAIEIHQLSRLVERHVDVGDDRVARHEVSHGERLDDGVQGATSSGASSWRGAVTTALIAAVTSVTPSYAAETRSRLAST